MGGFFMTKEKFDWGVAVLFLALTGFGLYKDIRDRLG